MCSRGKYNGSMKKKKRGKKTREGSEHFVRERLREDKRFAGTRKPADRGIGRGGFTRAIALMRQEYILIDTFLMPPPPSRPSSHQLHSLLVLMRSRVSNYLD